MHAINLLSKKDYHRVEHSVIFQSKIKQYLLLALQVTHKWLPSANLLTKIILSVVNGVHSYNYALEYKTIQINKAKYNND